MKLIKLTPDDAQYLLNATELHLFGAVLEKFPFTEGPPGEISRTANGQDPQTREREKLLKQSLAEHRRELTQSARNLLAGDRVKPAKKGHLLTLTVGDRETLLQILNDIRVGCWHALGQPEELETRSTKMTEQEFAWRNLMHLAGYFETAIVEEELSDED